MKKTTKTVTMTERPEAYPRTPECDKYLQMRMEHEDGEAGRAAWALIGAVGGTSGLNNASDNEKFRKIQYANDDCLMSAMKFFASQQAVQKITEVTESIPSNLSKNP